MTSERCVRCGDPVEFDVGGGLCYRDWAEWFVDLVPCRTPEERRREIEEILSEPLGPRPTEEEQRRLIEETKRLLKENVG